MKYHQTRNNRGTWRRCLSALLLMGMLCVYPAFAVTASADEQTVSREDKIRQYREELRSRDVTTDDLLIGSWISFYPFTTDSYEYQVKQLADAGLNFNIFPSGYLGAAMESASHWETVEALYAANNMVYFMNGGLNDSMRNTGVLYANGKQHCVGYHLVDEPGGGSMETVGDCIRGYRKADPARYPFVNLLPSYAGEAVLGGSYRDYVQGFVDAAGSENIEYLSHDYYVFRAGGESMDIFSDMEVIRSVAYANGKLKTHAFPQSTKWTGMRMPNIDEMRWNVYAYLAYGFKALSWFNVVCPGQSDTEGEGFSQSLIYRDGTITDKQLWADFSDLNWEVRGLSDVLMNLDTAHAYHTNKNMRGVQILPADFFIQPEGKANFVISYMVAKDGTQPYIMLFNNSIKDSIEMTFAIAPASGLTAMEYLDPLTGEYIPMDTADGTLTDTFRPGEGKLYRLQGDISTTSKLPKPTASIAGGHYEEVLSVELSAEDGLPVCYTLDGSYPTPDSPRYTAPIPVGEKDRFTMSTIRFATVSGSQMSDVVTCQYYVEPIPGNVAEGCPVTFTAPFTAAMDGRDPAELITDGVRDIRESAETAAGRYGWAMLDLGKTTAVNRVRVSAPDFARSEFLFVQVSDDVNFETQVQTVFAFDPQGVTGYKAFDTTLPADGSVTFESTSGRYVRVLLGVNKRSTYAEIEVYTPPYGIALADVREAGLEKTAGSAWRTEDGIVYLDSPAADTPTGLFVKDAAFDRFVVSTSLTITGSGIAGIAFEGGQGASTLYVGISDKGIPYLMLNGTELTTNKKVRRSPRYDLHVDKLGTSLRVSVNDTVLLDVTDNALAMGQGKVGLFGLNGAVFEAEGTVFTAIDATEIRREIILASVAEAETVTVPLYTGRETLLSLLPGTVSVTDRSGNTFDCPAAWKLDDCNGVNAGTQTLTGVLLLPADTLNPDGLEASVTLRIPYEVNLYELKRAIAVTESLDPDNYTPESWAAVNDYYQSALSMLDGSVPQNAVTVGAWQLMDRINALVPTHIDFAALDDAVSALRAVDASTLTAASRTSAEAALAAADGFSRVGTLTQTDVDTLTAWLKSVRDGLIVKGDRTALDVLIAECRALRADDWTPESFSVLERALRDTEALNLSDASADMIQKIQSGLESAKTGLIPAGKGGCSSAVSASALSAVLLAGAAAVLFGKRKEKGAYCA